MAGASQRAELIARILSKPGNGTSGPVRGELLSTLLSDTANLTQFIRYSGLSEEVGAALLRDAMSATARPAQLSPQSMGEISDMLSRIGQQRQGVDASYGVRRQLRGDRVRRDQRHCSRRKNGRPAIRAVLAGAGGFRQDN